MIKILRSQRGYMLMNVIFLTLITSFAGLMLMNGAIRLENPKPTLRLIALHLVDEQVAYLESLAAAGDNIVGTHSFPKEFADDLIVDLGKSSSDKTKPDKQKIFVFDVTATVEPGNNKNTLVAKITVTCKSDGEDYKLGGVDEHDAEKEFTVERTIYFAK